jgi:hypothetical protein
MVWMGVARVNSSAGRTRGSKEASGPRAWSLPEPFADEEEAARPGRRVPEQTGKRLWPLGLGDAEVVGVGFVEPEGDDLVAGEDDLLGGRLAGRGGTAP